MNQIGPISLGDLARVKRRLQPKDARTWNQILDLLGLPLEMRPHSPELRPEEDVPDAGSLDSFETPEDSEQGDSNREVVRARPLFTPGSELEVKSVGLANSPPAWVGSTDVFAIAGEAKGLGPPPPLFAPRHSRALLTAVAIALVKSGELDEELAIRQIARGEPLREIPLRLRPTSRFGVQLLVDRGPRLQPFREDQQQLKADLLQTVGVHRVEVLRFAGFPDKAGPGTPRSWVPYVPPTAGTVVLVVSDLGLGWLESIEASRELGAWVAWGRRVRSAGARPVALVPHGRESWPAALRSAMTLVHWDRSTTVSEVRMAKRWSRS